MKVYFAIDKNNQGWSVTEYRDYGKGWNLWHYGRPYPTIEDAEEQMRMRALRHWMNERSPEKETVTT